MNWPISQVLILNQSPISTIHLIVRNLISQKTVLTGDPLYYTMIYNKSKNLKNRNFFQSRTKIVLKCEFCKKSFIMNDFLQKIHILIEIKFAKFWHIGGWCAPVCLIDTLKNLVFYTKVTIKGCVKFVKQVSKKLILCRFSSSMTVFYLLRTYFYIIRHALKPKHKIHLWTFLDPCISVQWG